MTAPNRYDELGPLTRSIIDRMINALASSPSTAAVADAYAAARAYDAYAAARATIDAAYDADAEVK